MIWTVMLGGHTSTGERPYSRLDSSRASTEGMSCLDSLYGAWPAWTGLGGQGAGPRRSSGSGKGIRQSRHGYAWGPGQAGAQPKRDPGTGAGTRSLIKKRREGEHPVECQATESQPAQVPYPLALANLRGPRDTMLSPRLSGWNMCFDTRTCPQRSAVFCLLVYAKWATVTQVVIASYCDRLNL